MGFNYRYHELDKQIGLEVSQEIVREIYPDAKQVLFGKDWYTHKIISQFNNAIGIGQYYTSWRNAAESVTRFIELKEIKKIQPRECPCCGLIYGYDVFDDCGVCWNCDREPDEMPSGYSQ